MSTYQIFYLSFSIIFISISGLVFIYLNVRKRHAEIITLKIVEVRVNYWSRYHRTYPVCLVKEHGEEREVSFKKVRIRKFSQDDNVGLRVYRVLKNDTFHYYSVINYYSTAYILMLLPIIMGLMALVKN